MRQRRDANPLFEEVSLLFMLGNRGCAVRAELGATFGDSGVTAGWRDGRAAKRAKCSVIAEQHGPRGPHCLRLKLWDTAWFAAGGSEARVWISQEQLLCVEVMEAVQGKDSRENDETRGRVLGKDAFKKTKNVQLMKWRESDFYTMMTFSAMTSAPL